VIAHLVDERGGVGEAILGGGFSVDDAGGGVVGGGEEGGDEGEVGGAVEVGGVQGVLLEGVVEVVLGVAGLEGAEGVLFRPAVVGIGGVIVTMLQGGTE